MSWRCGSFFFSLFLLDIRGGRIAGGEFGGKRRGTNNDGLIAGIFYKEIP